MIDLGTWTPSKTKTPEWLPKWLVNRLHSQDPASADAGFVESIIPGLGPEPQTCCFKAVKPRSLSLSLSLSLSERQPNKKT